MSGREQIVRARIVACMILLSVGAVSCLKAAPHGLFMNILMATRVELLHPPRLFSPLHLVGLAVCALGTVALCRLSRGLAQGNVDRIVFAMGMLFWILELYKQLLGFFVIGNGLYDFSLLPFQFCSLPLYMCLLAPLLPGKGWRSACYAFLALYGTVGGYLVLLAPRLDAQFNLSLHTLLWHGLMVMLGLFLLVSLPIGKDPFRELLPSGGIFTASLTAATLLNLILRGRAELGRGVLNLFYLSPWEESDLWLLGELQARLGWLPMMVAYWCLFSLLGAIPLWFLGRFILKRRKRKEICLKNVKK